MKKPGNTNAAQLGRHFKVLCERIGVRYSGTQGEQDAADYVEERFRRYGLSNVRRHEFEFPNWDFSSGSLRLRRGGRWRRVKTARPSVYSRSTPADGIRGRVVYLEGGSEMDFARELRGKIGLLIGTLSLGDPAVKARLIKSKLAALIFVDARAPHDWTISTGFAPQWMDGFEIPVIGISYFDALDIVKALPAEAEVRIRARTFPAMSQNIIGEITGTTRPEEVILVSGHHDSVWGVVGANDNGSGVVFTLELARLFAKRRPRRTIRFASYGVEEKLSIGSYLYMRSLSAKQRKQVVLAVNADACASLLGKDALWVTGSAALVKLAEQTWRSRRHPVSIEPKVACYSDHFPFNICGVPSIMVTRRNIFDSMIWELHSEHDNLDNISIPVLCRTIDTTTALLERVATVERLPFAPQIPPKQMKEVRASGRQLYHHPWSPATFRYP